MDTSIVEAHGLYPRGRGKVHISCLLSDCLAVLVFPSSIRQSACSNASFSFSKRSATDAAASLFTVLDKVKQKCTPTFTLQLSWRNCKAVASRCGFDLQKFAQINPIAVVSFVRLAL
jgi:hypothetical protein